jgi:uncharacterized damage-inducible protein DinB
MRRILASLVLIGAAAAAAAQAPTTTSTQMPPRPAAASPAAGFMSDYAAEVDAVGKKLVELAQAEPADKYGWRPGPGVRSIGEVYMHVVGGNSTIRASSARSAWMGSRATARSRSPTRRRSSTCCRSRSRTRRPAGATITEADLDKKVKTFGGREMTQRQVLMLIVTHMHEHLGQSIAYARMNGITPPWSEGG